MPQAKPKKAPKCAPEVAELAIKSYFELGGKGSHGALSGAARGRVAKTTLLEWVKGHADAETALEAYRDRPGRGHPTLLKKAVERAMAALAVGMWKQNRTLTTDQLLAIATIEAEKAGTPFKVRLNHVCLGALLTPTECVWGGVPRLVGPLHDRVRTQRVQEAVSTRSSSRCERV